jgi:cellulose synthase/poly-beta-1,6-N-acetylglucosamine synthase-like glycosyltransferase
MTILVNLVFLIYLSALLAVTVYCLMQLHLLYNYQRYRYRLAYPAAEQPGPAQAAAAAPLDAQPFVTIQLPIYNEMYVAERLLDNIMQMDYPKDCFEVHVLDDSTDETREIVFQKVAHYKALGFNIAQVLRKDRKGFKAGALKDAMHLANGEFIAIFDADFLPNKDFLKNTLSHFRQPNVGVVQTRWEHLNEGYSILTRLQALQLNAHFSVEQMGRFAGNYLLQFNGTAGVWRRAAIEAAGGWEADTLTEDLDLSIRAQLLGWKIVYLEEVGSPAELPAEMNGLKSQQFRWMKGGAETAKKMLPTVWRSQLKFSQKIHATVQLFSSTVFVFVFLLGVFSVPVLFLMGQLKYGSGTMQWCLVGFFAFMLVQYVANVERPFLKGSYPKRLMKFTLLFPIFLAFSMGLSLHNSVAVLQGWLGRQSAFIRTPKFNIRHLQDSFKNHHYLAHKISWTTLLEGVLAVYFLLAVWQGYKMNNAIFLVMHSLLALGYGAIFYYTIRHLKFR